MSLQETGEQLDIDEYDHLVFRVHGDGRKYIANMRTENWLVGGPSHDVWQAVLFARYSSTCMSCHYARLQLCLARCLAVTCTC